jgi:hypothetical protein
MAELVGVGGKYEIDPDCTHDVTQQFVLVFYSCSRCTTII